MDYIRCISGLKKYAYCLQLRFHFFHLGQAMKPCGSVGKGKNFAFPIRSNGAELCKGRIVRSRVNLSGDWSFIGGSRIIVKPKATRLLLHYPKRGQMQASCNPFLCYIYYF